MWVAERFCRAARGNYFQFLGRLDRTVGGMTGSPGEDSYKDCAAGGLVGRAFRLNAGKLRLCARSLEIFFWKAAGMLGKTATFCQRLTFCQGQFVSPQGPEEYLKLPCDAESARATGAWSTVRSPGRWRHRWFHTRAACDKAFVKRCRGWPQRVRDCRHSVPARAGCVRVPGLPIASAVPEV